MELSGQAKELRNAYQRAYRLKNPDKIKQYNVRYWEKKAASHSIADQAKELHLLGFTQREIAQMLHISVGTVNNYLNQK